MIKTRHSLKRSAIVKDLNVTDTEIISDEITPPSAVQFWTFLIFEIPSLACTIFLLYHLFFNAQLRRALHNHVIIVFLLLTFFIEVLDNPLYMDAYLFDGKNSFPMTQSICLMWWLIDFGFYGAITVYLAWGSIERHILVFHYHQLLRTPRQRFFLHYIPLIITSVYIFGFYIGVIFFPSCVNQFDYESLGCGLTPCYTDKTYLNAWDYLGNGIICSFIEIISSVALLIRVFLQKRRVCQRVTWRRHRKMAFQLLSISWLSLTIVFPQSLITVIQQSGKNMEEFGAAALPYFDYLYTFLVFFLPFISLASYPELWPKLLFFRRKKTDGKLAMIKPTIDRLQSKAIQSQQI